MEKVTDNILKEYANVIKFDGKISRDSDNIPLRFTKDELLTYKDIKYIKDIKIFRYNFATTYKKNFLKDFEKGDDGLTIEFNINGDVIPLGFPLRPVFIFGYNISLLNLAVNDIKLENGRMFETDNECVIVKNKLYPNIGKWNEESGGGIESKDWNDLDLDDKIIIKDDDGFYNYFIVVGIIEQNFYDDITTNRCMIYTTLESAEYFDAIASEEDMNFEINNYEKIKMGYEGLIYLDDPDNYYVLRAEMFNRGIWIEPLFPNFHALTNLTNSMQAWSIIFMIFATFIIICITIISTIILLNNRKYEIAILRSVGMKKSRLIINYLIENLTFIWGVTFISLITEQFITGIFTKDVSAVMQNLVSPKMFEQLTQGVNFETLLLNIGLVFGGTTAVVMLSLILACINIIRFEPLKIFNKQY